MSELLKAKEAFNMVPDRKINKLPTEHQDKLVELAEAVSGNVHAQIKVRTEALTTSDYPEVFTNIVSAVAEGEFAEQPLLWTTVAGVEYVDGFGKERTLDLRVMSDTSNLPKEVGGRKTALNSLPAVPELAPYPEIGYQESDLEMYTRKSGAKFALSWELFKTDRWSRIAKIPGDFARLAANTTEMNIWQLFFGGQGFNLDTFTAGTRLSGNPALSIDSLQDAVAEAKKMPTIVDGQPMRINTVNKFALITSPNLTLTARNILATTEVQVTDGDNIFKRSVDFGAAIEHVEVPFVLNLANTATGNYASTMWALVPYGGQGSEVTSVASINLRGHESPDLRVKNDAGNAIGGCQLGYGDGSFDNDDIQFRVRHINNGMVLDPERMGFVASKGNNSAW